MDFVGRKEELSLLKNLLMKRSAQLVVIRGRRRIGKSRLAEQFGKNFSRVFIFSGLAPQEKVTARLQREDFARQMGNLLDIPPPKSEDWGDLFRVLASYVRKNRVLLVFDEITWMGGKDPTFLGKLKTAWDLYFKKNPDLILILSGSISSWIEKNILASTGFVGRISLDLVLNPLPLADCDLFFAKNQKISAYEKFKLLSITGGIPRYLEEITPAFSAEKNIQTMCFQPGGLLFREFNDIFSDLFSKRSNTYQEIVRSLINGPKFATEICKLLGIKKTGTLHYYLSDLATAGFITKDYTWHLGSLKQSKLARYRLSDNYTRFFLKYIEPNKAPITSGAFTTLPTYESILGLQFENLVVSYRKALWRHLGIDPMEIAFENPYFQKQTNRQKSCQVDYMVQTKHGSLYVCEIKFSKEPIGTAVIEEVKEKVKRLKVPKYFSIRPVLIHVNGVKDSAKSFFSSVLDLGSFLRSS